MKSFLLSLALISLLLTNCSKKITATDNASINPETTKQVLEHHWNAFKANDLEGTMADYTEESVLITPDKTYKGLAEIRENFVSAFAAFPKDSTTMQLQKSLV